MSKYEPKPETVAELVATKSPEQLAVAYLRATHRAKQQEKGLELISGLMALEDAVSSRNKANTKIKSLLDELGVG